MFLEQIMRKERTLIEMRDRATRALPPMSRATEGRTIGLKIPDALRERLVKQVERVGAKSYSQVVMLCIELGLEDLEQSK